MSMKEFADAIKANKRIAAFWVVIVILGVGGWWVFSGRSSSSANAEEQAGNEAAAGQPTVAQGTPAIVNTPSLSITPGKPRTIVTKPVTKSGAMDEYSYMARLNNLQGPQLEKFEQACAEREVVLAFWAKGPGKLVEEVREQMKDAKAAKDQDVIARIQEKHDLLNQMDLDMRTMLRADVMAGLTIEQQRRWGGFVISRELQRRMSRIELSDRQKEFLERMSDDAADKHVKPDSVAKDPFLNALRTAEVIDPLLKQVRNKILTIEQSARVPDPGKPQGATVSNRPPGAIVKP